VLYHFLYPLKVHFFPFNVFRYITFRASYAALTSLLLTYFLMPIFIRFIKKRGITERIYEYLPETHKRKEGTPTAGGIVFLPAAIISVLLWANLKNPFVLMAIFSTTLLGLLGFVDDLMKVNGKRGLSKKAKLFGQLILSLIVFFFAKANFPGKVAFSTQVLFFKNYFLYLGLIYIAFLMFVFVGVTNSVNLTDGLDGLAAGCALAPFGVFAVLAYVSGHKIISNYLNILFIPKAGELTIFATSFFGALLGFLWYNAYPAQIFMGDTGSQAVGGALGILAILTKQEILLAIAGGVFVIEALSVILQVIYFRTTGGKRFLRKAPLHHHYEEIGQPETKIVIRFWIVSFLLGVVALSTLKIR